MEFKFKKAQERRFWKWINDRHLIYMQRESLRPGPWTKDKILRKFKFTNPFRQLDRVTREWRNRYVYILGMYKHEKASYGDILFHCCMFRLFNLPATYDTLFFKGIWYSGKKKKAKDDWSKSKALKLLRARQEAGEQIFTGAYIVPNLGLTTPKIEIIVDALHDIWKQRNELARRIMKAKRMQICTEILQEIESIGPFIAYEITCDLRFTKLLSNARDKMTWANPGPGARRGINRLMTGQAVIKGKKPDYIAAMKQLLDSRNEPGKLAPHVKKYLKEHEHDDLMFEMREIEHSLCEFDKYMRVKNGEGRPRSLFRPKDLPWEKKQEWRYGKKVTVKELKSGKA